MEKVIIDFINKQESVYIVETKNMVLDSKEHEIGREVLGTSNKGVVYEYMWQYGIEKWQDIENYSLVSLDVERSKIICVFDCKTLESSKVDLEIY